VTSYEIHPGDLPSWVTIESGPALFAVFCARCGAIDVAYHVVIARDREWLARTVRTHAVC
jgi:hypothetical protein